MANCKSDLSVEGFVSTAAKDEEPATEKPTSKDDDAKEEVSGDADAAAGDDKEDAAPVPTKKARMSKAATMVNTAKEGNEILAGEKLGETRQDTQAKKSRPSAPKKNRTIQQTMEEAKYFMDTEKIDLNEGRRTRSAGKPKPEVKKEEPAAKEVKKDKKGGKKGGKKEDKKKDEKTEIEEADEKEASE